MIYICVATHNNARSIGLLLWKMRKVFHEVPREYHVLAADYGSTDETREVLENYQGAVPLSIEQLDTTGYARTLEGLLRVALARSDRPKRDLAITLPADYRASPAIIPTLVRSFESGADVIVGETQEGERSFGRRLVRRSAAWLLRPGVRVPGVRDLTSGVNGYRLVTLRNSLRNVAGPLLQTEGMCADAELLARAAGSARQVAVVHATEHHTPATDSNDVGPWSLAMNLFRAGRSLSVPPPTVEATRA
ncbi:MAG: glycosyltransferase [Gemmatimonadales bacterium]